MASLSTSIDTREFVTVEVSVRHAGAMRTRLGMALLKIACWALRYRDIRVVRGE